MEQPSCVLGVTNTSWNIGGDSSVEMHLRHVLFRAKIGVVDSGVFAGVVLLAGQLGVVQTARVAECASSIGSTSPLGSFGSVAAVAAARWCSTTSALFRVRTCKSSFHVIFVVRG